jgi:putative effector of murein hydrolase
VPAVTSPNDVLLHVKHISVLLTPAPLPLCVCSRRLPSCPALCFDGCTKHTDWARAFIPRSVTGSTASHFSAAIGAPAECAGLVVLLQAAFTIALGASILKVADRRSKTGPLSPAAAGTAVGVTAGAMGVAGVCGGDEVALANGAVAYACMVLVGSVLSSVPSVAAGLAALVA